MNTPITPSMEAFKSDIESFLGYPLSESTTEAAEDFWKNWQSFDALVGQDNLSIKIDTDSLGESYPAYSHYHRWTGAGTAAIVIGLVIVWFNWQVGIISLLVGLGLHFWGSRIKNRDVRGFADDLIKTVVENSKDGGYARFCACYITGTISLSSSTGSARWPQHPSNVVTGSQSFITT